MERLVRASFALAAVVNLLPMLGVLSAARLESFYGIAIGDPALEVLLRHRALLFGVAGGLLLYAVFQPSLRALAAVAGLASMLSFVAIVWWVGDANPELRRVARVDVVASLVLVAGVVLDSRRG